VNPIIVTMGDPTGVGPEIIVKALREGELDGLSHPLLVAGDAKILLRAAHLFDPTATIQTQQSGRSLLRSEQKELAIAPLSELDPATFSYGNPDPACGKAMADYVNWATDQCIGKKAAAIVTCPINKAALNAAGICFPGHTELLAERCGVDKVVMMLAGERLRVCMVTTHLALRRVPEVLTSAAILSTIQIVNRSLQQQFQLKQPRLAVLALNPHAGEAGLFGDEEERLIVPAIKAACEADIHASGPHSADTLFHFATQGQYDAVICMYHDQGLIPLKLLHFEDAVNVTLGLPIVRTSVDHGTAYNLAGTGQASAKSLVAAIKMAEKMI